MNLYISDLHFGHANAIKFDQRPYAYIQEMDRCMIDLWNSRVSDGDDVYIVGDFCYRSEKPPEWYLQRLKGHKHLIVGNHDKVTLDSANAAKYLESVDKLLHLSDSGKQICLCHFPIAEWNQYWRGSWHIYGHIHAKRGPAYQFMKLTGRALNAAACINNYMPASFEELQRNNALFQAQDETKESIIVAKNKVTGEEIQVRLEDLITDYELHAFMGE